MLNGADVAATAAAAPSGTAEPSAGRRDSRPLSATSPLRQPALSGLMCALAFSGARLGLLPAG